MTREEALKKHGVGTPIPLKSGGAAIIFPNGELRGFQSSDEAMFEYDEFLQQQRIDADVSGVKDATKRFLRFLPGVVGEGAATMVGEAKRAAGEIGSGLKNIGSSAGMLIPLTEGTLTGPRITTPASRGLQGAAQVGIGALRGASAVPMGVGELAGGTVSAGLETAGMDPNRARQGGDLVNIALQTALEGFVPTRALKVARNMPGVRRFIGESGDIVENATRKTLQKEFGFNLPPKRLAFKFKENYGLALGEFERGVSEGVSKAFQRVERAIPTGVRRNPERTRDALFDLADTMGFTRRAGAGSPGGRATTKTERDAGKWQRLVGTLSKEDVDELRELGFSQRMLQDFGENELNFITMDQLRKDVGEALGAAQRRRTLSNKERAALSKVYDGLRDDIRQFSDEFPDAIQHHTQAMDTFQNVVVPIRKFTQAGKPSEVVDLVMKAPVEDIRALRRTLTKDQSRDLAAVTLGTKMEEVFDETGLFKAGAFRAKLDTEEMRRAIAELVSPEEFKSYTALMDVLQEASKPIALTQRIGAFMRPMALVNMFRANFSTGGAFVIPAILKETGRQEGARRILAAAGKRGPRSKFDIVRSVFATMETARRKLEQERKFLAEAHGQSVEPSPFENIMGVLQQRRARTAQPPSQSSELP